MNEKKTTSIKVDPDLWKEVKKYCIDKGIDVSDFLEDMIRKEINKNKKKQ